MPLEIEIGNVVVIAIEPLFFLSALVPGFIFFGRENWLGGCCNQFVYSMCASVSFSRCVSVRSVCVCVCGGSLSTLLLLAY